MSINQSPSLKCPCDRCYRIWKMEVSIYYHVRQSELLLQGLTQLSEQINEEHRRNPNNQHLMHERLLIEEQYIVRSPQASDKDDESVYSEDQARISKTAVNPLYHLPSFDAF